MDDYNAALIRPVTVALDRPIIAEKFAIFLNIDIASICFSMCFRFAYIVFADSETADSVLSDKQGADLEGNALYLDRTGSKSSFTPRDRQSRDSFGGRGDGARKPSGRFQ